MADNTILNPGSGGDTIATDDISGVKHQKVKIEYGIDDSATQVSTTNPLPVTLANTGANSTAVKVDNSAVTQPVSGTFFQATQPVSGTVTANAGTNLNTSALALETGGNLASIKADADNLNLAQGSTTSGQKGNLGLAAVTTAAPTYTTAQSSPLSMDTSGNLRVAGTFSANPPSSVISSVNSTTANLAGAAVFTGTGEDVSNYAALQISVFSSHASATDGLSLQQSSDNTNWDITDTYSVPATTGKVFSVQPASQYFRLVYTNGATLTTSLRIKVVYHYSAPNPSSQRAADAYTNETDLTQQWSFNSLYNGTTWDRMRGDTTNGLDVDVTRMAALVAGAAVIGKVGIDQTTPGTTNLVALAANQSINSAQVNGAAINVGTGAAGTGTQRVTTSTDSTIGTVTTLTTLTGTTTLTPGTGAANLGKAEDAAAASGDSGVAVFGVRNDSLTAAQTSATGDYGSPSIDTSGILIVAGAPRALKGRAAITITSSTTETSILAATASTFHDVYGLILTNTSATVTKVTIRDATGAGTASVFEVPPTDTRGFMLPLDSAIPQGAVNTAWTAQCGTSVSALEVTLLYVSRV